MKMPNDITPRYYQMTKKTWKKDCAKYQDLRNKTIKKQSKNILGSTVKIFLPKEERAIKDIIQAIV